jgi:guanine nucleotide-binding protein subunit alpha
LLGQAESGKSTLQKQFQLMYSPKSLEVSLPSPVPQQTIEFISPIQSERASWRTVVYFNIVRSLKHILVTLAAYEDIDDGSDANSTIDLGENTDDGTSITEEPSSRRSRSGKATAFTNVPSASTSSASTSKLKPKSTRGPSSGQNPLSKSPHHQPSTHQIANLRLRLSPLVSSEEALAKRLNGGVNTGSGEVFVRSGWQVRTIENGGLAKARRPKRSLGHGQGPPSNSGSGLLLEEDPLLDDVSAMFEGSKDDIKDLWDHPTVVALIAKRKLKLDEWSEL